MSGVVIWAAGSISFIRLRKCASSSGEEPGQGIGSHPRFPEAWLWLPRLAALPCNIGHANPRKKILVSVNLPVRMIGHSAGLKRTGIVSSGA